MIGSLVVTSYCLLLFGAPSYKTYDINNKNLASLSAHECGRKVYLTKKREKYKSTCGCLMDLAKCIGGVHFVILFISTEESEPCLRMVKHVLNVFF